jgi:hypothetical protein
MDKKPIIFINKLLPNDQLLIPHDFPISSGRQIAIRLNVALSAGVIWTWAVSG